MTWYCEICDALITGEQKSFGELCGFCREAYQRGREDAVDNVGAFIARFHYHFSVEVVEPLLAAARGDGEQA